MSDASTSSPPHASSPGRSALALRLGLALTLIGLALAAALRRPFSPAEADLVLASAELGADPAGLQAAWNSWAGTMPRVLRGAGLIGFATAIAGLFAIAGLLAINSRRQVTAPASSVPASAAFSALFVFAAVPAVWMQGTGIAGGAPYLIALFALVAVLRFFGLGLAPIGGLALALSAGLPYALHALSQAQDTSAASSDLDLSAFGLPLSFVALAVLSLLLVMSARRRGPLALLLAGVAAAWVVFTLQHGAHQVLFALPLAAAALALVASASAFRTASLASTRVFLGAAVLALVVTVILGPFRQDSPLPREAEALDWITGQVDQRALVIHHGAAGSWRRYLEERGHRTGHTSVRSADATELRNWADRAVLDGLNRIALTVSEDEVGEMDLDTVLGPKWQRVPVASAPALVHLYAR